MGDRMMLCISIYLSISALSIYLYLYIDIDIGTQDKMHIAMETELCLQAAFKNSASRHKDIYLPIYLSIYLSISIYLCIYGIHQWRILWSSYRKLAWVGFESTTTEFRSDAPTYWAIRPRVQLALRVNFLQLLQFNCLFSVKFHFGSCLHQSPCLT